LCDLDKTASSRDLITSFTNSGYFTVEYSTEEYASIQHYLDNHKATLALVIPKGFGNHMLRKESAKLQVLLDGSEGSASAVTMGYVNQIIMKYSSKILAEIIGSRQTIGSVNAEIRAWYNPALKSRNFMVPGVLVMILLITTTNLTSMAIVKEKEIGTLEQLLVTPIKAPELILGKLVPFIIIAAVNVCVVLVAMVVGFGIEIKGSLGLLILLSSFFLLTSLGLGLFVSTVSRTQQQAMMTAQFFIIMPMMYLSGFTFPIENMPAILQFISCGIPMRYFLVIVRSIILKGVGFGTLWYEAMALLGMGVVILVLSMLRFHRKLD
ncbi:MAG: ABC transporter permease, partial [Ignavibacteriales bacterium]|nr:ABC transporter permease [Ignavibacteriales bacterium]